MSEQEQVPGSMSAAVQGQAAIAEPTQVNPLQTFVIPQPAQSEILRLHEDTIAKAKAFEEIADQFETKRQEFEACRLAFREYIRTVKRIVGVPNDKPYTITDDAAYFQEVLQ